ncbi:glycerophosphodiester phosphodiesterase family protein [Bacillus sp. JCM 19041]|uniref:glycerophosphodiester phosphodiesterase family protein n=1 Tax=Bacillus sp. JCM 19041 TaxID=1460637 RepID=UPI000B0C14E1
MTAIYGHRGAAGTHPENTLLSFEEALNNKVDGIELDVQMTKDGQLIIMHDPTVDRTTSGSGYVNEMTLMEIKQLSAGSKFSHMTGYDSNTWPSIEVPTLRETLNLIRPHRIELNIEFKPNLATHKGIEEAVLKEVESHGQGLNVSYSSFHLPILMRLKALKKEVETAYLVEQNVPFPRDYLETFDLTTFHVSKKQLLGNSYFEEEKLLEDIRAWTVNRDEDIKKLLQKNVKAIMTDFPKRAIALRDDGV